MARTASRPATEVLGRQLGRMVSDTLDDVVGAFVLEVVDLGDDPAEAETREAAARDEAREAVLGALVRVARRHRWRP